MTSFVLGTRQERQAKSLLQPGRMVVLPTEILSGVSETPGEPAQQADGHSSQTLPQTESTWGSSGTSEAGTRPGSRHRRSGVEARTTSSGGPQPWLLVRVSKESAEKTPTSPPRVPTELTWGGLVGQLSGRHSQVVMAALLQGDLLAPASSQEAGTDAGSLPGLSGPDRLPPQATSQDVTDHLGVRLPLTLLFSSGGGGALSPVLLCSTVSPALFLLPLS